MRPKVIPKSQSATPGPTPPKCPYVVGGTGGGGVGAQSEQIGNPISPRESARRNLPELDRTFDRLKATFGPGVTLERLVTPDGTWGSDPTADWPRVNATDLAPVGAWQSQRAPR